MLRSLSSGVCLGGLKTQRTRILQMGKAIIYMVLSAIAVFAGPGMLPAQDKLSTEPLALVEDPPSRYVVVKGDTLWDISARFLRDPWRWPDIWGLNRDEIKNPHWIYPGDVLILDFTGKTPRLRFESDTGWTLVRQRLSPQMRSYPLDSGAVPTISENLLKSYLDNTIIVQKQSLQLAPTIVSGQEGRIILGPGDRLLKVTPRDNVPYMPRPPSREINGRIIAAADEGVTEIGPLTVVVLNRGTRDGLEIGNVLELSRAGETMRPAGSTDPKQRVTLPDETYGVVFVFKVYERLSYALVMNTTRSVKVNDRVLTPS